MQFLNAFISTNPAKTVIFVRRIVNYINIWPKRFLNNYFNIFLKYHSVNKSLVIIYIKYKKYFYLHFFDTSQNQINV